jgi:mannan endo-1,4-beta-mannosidase
MKIGPLTASALLALSLAAGRAAAQTADPGASARTKAVLAYVRSLTEGGGRRVLSGQFLEFAPNATLSLPEAIHQASGKWPAYIGVDYMNFRTQSIDTEAADRVSIDYWGQGGLVEVNVHLTNPANPKGGGLRDKGVDLSEVLRAGSAANIAWIHELDLIAGGLGRLQDAGVVVLWRPFHEMNGGWFWWGAKPPADFIALWRQMFAYFTGAKHLHNLIWIYSPNMGANAGDYYPGDGYADMVGLDAYTDYVDADHIKGFAALLKTGKPAGFGEYGPHGASNPPGTYEYTKFGDGLAANFPRAVFFMAWNDKWCPAKNLNAKEFYNDPSTVTRGDLPPGLLK